jgi:lysophospholipase L1-like esterase
VPLLATAACNSTGSLPPPSARPARSSPTGATSPQPSRNASPNPAKGRITVLGLGDSVTSASACSCAGFVQDFAGLLSRRRGTPVRSINLGQPGLTSVQLDQELHHDSPVRRAVGTADIVLITIGANDLMPSLAAWDAAGCDDTCAGSGVRGVRSRISSIVDQVHALRHGLPAQVLVTNYWNVFEDGDVASADRGQKYLVWSDRITQRLNASICAAATSGGATCVDLYAPFKGDGTANPTRLLAADGDHPNAAGHAAIARALMTEVQGNAGGGGSG